MKKLAILAVFLVVVSAMAFADDFVAVRVTGANASPASNHTFSFSNSFSMNRASSFEEAIASLCNFMNSNNYELVRMDQFSNSTSWVLLFKLK